MTSPEHLHDNQELIDAQDRAELIEQLAEHRIYTEDAPITQFISERVSVLCGDSTEMPTVYVLDDDTPNAFALPGVIVVNRGLVELMDSTEEIDGILGHEHIHITEDHGHRSAQEDSELGRLGKIRIHEIEADIRSMLRLNEKGINPRGFISALEKLADYSEAQYEKQKKHHHASPTHGDTRERAVTLEQAAWLFDMKHLTPAPLTPKPLSSEEYGQFDETPGPGHLSLMRRQALLARSVQRHINTETLDSGTCEAITSRQRDLLIAADPTLSDEDALRMARLAVTNLGLPFSVTPDYETIQQNLNDMEHPAVLQTVGSLTPKARQSISRAGISSAIEADLPFADLQEVVELYRASMPAMRLGMDVNGISFEAALISALHRYKGDRQRVKALTRIMADTNIQVRDLYTAKELPFLDDDSDTSGYNSSDPRLGYATRQLASIKYEQAKNCENIVDLLVALSPHYDFPEHTVDMPEESEDIIASADFNYWQGLALETSSGAANELYYCSALNNMTYDARNKTFTKIPWALQKPADPVVGRLQRSCIEFSPAEIAGGLAERSDLTNEQKNLAARLWLAYRDMIPSTDPSIHKTSILPLLFEAQSEHFISEAEQVLQRRMDLRFDWRHDQSSEAVEYIHQGEKYFFKEEVEPENLVGEGVGAYLTLLMEDIREAFGDLSDPAVVERSNQAIQQLNEQSATIRTYRTLAAIEALAYTDDLQPLLDLLDDMVPQKITSNAYYDVKLHEYAIECWQQSVEKILERPDILEDEDCLKALVALGIVSDNIEVNLHVPGHAFAALLKERDFQESMELVFTTYAHLPRTIMAQAINILIEEKAKTFEDFAQLEEVMLDHLDGFIDTHSTRIGAGTIAETIVIDAYKTSQQTDHDRGYMYDRMENLESVRLISALLTSAQSDEDLKKYIFERWWHANRLSPQTREFFTAEEIIFHRHAGKEARLKWWVNQLPQAGDYVTLSAVLDSLYLSDDNARFMLVRKLMLGDGGVLRDENGHTALVESFMSSWLKDQGENADALLRNIISSFLGSANAERVYQYIGPVLQDLILKPPKESSSSDNIAVNHSRQIIDDLISRGKLNERSINGREQPALAQKIVNLMRGSTTETVDHAAQTKQQLMRLFELERDDNFEQVSPTELALLVGKKAGSLGVRMLQLAGQYYDIPEEERPKFNEVYDSIKGQKRIQAYKLLLREAEDNPKMFELIDNIKVFGERLGGGSLMTVYEVTMQNGSKRVVGVRNPNAEFHVIQIADVLQKTLATAAQNDPDNLDLKIAETLVVDAVRWIRDELNDTDFVHKDPVFRMENDTRTGNGFSRGRSRYDLYVPQAYDTGTPWVRHEDFVPGVNLNNLIISDDPTDLTQNKISSDDYKDAVSLLVRNTLHQVQHGRYVHSDGHGGNYRITADNKSVAVFDRYNLIEMDDGLRETIEKAITNIAVGNQRQAVESIIGGVDSSLSGAQVQQIVTDVTARLSDQEDVAKDMMGTLIELKKAGIEIPVKLSLILRNMFSMTQLSQKAGFDDIVGAFMHTASEEEIEALMQRFGQ